MHSILSPTPPARLVDGRGRPYFLWDVDMTLDAFLSALADRDRDTRAYLIGKLMRQAKPDDVFSFVSLDEIRDLWPDLSRYLGKTREFWAWLLDAWSDEPRGGTSLECRTKPSLSPRLG